MSKITKSIWATPKGFAVMELVIIYLRHAKSKFGQAYLDYLQHTPAWIPISSNHSSNLRRRSK
jgi:protein-S-isoprenylcysteine O-methyltransferase Ste14